LLSGEIETSDKSAKAPNHYTLSVNSSGNHARISSPFPQSIPPHRGTNAIKLRILPFVTS
jgi:hypothetical protein